MAVVAIDEIADDSAQQHLGMLLIVDYESLERIDSIQWHLYVVVAVVLVAGVVFEMVPATK